MLDPPLSEHARERQAGLPAADDDDGTRPSMRSGAGKRLGTGAG